MELKLEKKVLLSGPAENLEAVTVVCMCGPDRQVTGELPSHQTDDSAPAANELGRNHSQKHSHQEAKAKTCSMMVFLISW